MGFLDAFSCPSQSEVWQKLCDEVGANYIEGQGWNGGMVEIEYGQWTITLDLHTITSHNGKTSSSTTYTRIRAPYVNPEEFRFHIYRKHFFSAVGKFFGFQDIEVGFPQFDDDFVIKGNDEEKVRQLFANEQIRGLIEAQPQVSFSVADHEGWLGPKYPEGVDCLTFMAVGVIRDVEQLKSLYWLFATTLDHLCAIGAAYEGDPELEVK